MIKIQCVLKDLDKQAFDGYVFFVEYPFSIDQFDEEDKKIISPLMYAIKSKGFTGSAKSHVELTGTYNDRGIFVILLGLGSRDKGINKINSSGDTNEANGTKFPKFLENYRRAVGRMVRYVENNRIKKVGFKLPNANLFGITIERLAQETSTIIHKAAYHFDEFITSPERKLKFEIEYILCISDDKLNDAKKGIEKGIIIAEGINLARYWCDLPGSMLTPTKVADNAKEIANKHGLGVKIFNQKEVIDLGMGGLYGVARGSHQECRFVIMEYKSSKKDAPTIALVGKGITFDTGGLCLKPSASMESMKDDMAGAAVVIATMQVVAQLKPDVNVIALTPLTENMPGGNATKPGDILTFYNGKTAEVKDTDAEGRLVLADALSYAVKNYKLDAIIDIATLTGACAAALGHFYCGLLSQHDELVEKIYKASNSSGDRVWRLPLDEDYKPSIVSEVADIANIGTARYKGGAITAAFFLQHFVDDVPWVHLDVAGTAFGVPDMTYLRPGATGFGIRLFVDLLENF